ncbi:MAG: hypothetical protein JST89_20605 [Cyanobacteria bacterium SZAS-4]|nr:hypothetical protein [Cyanobacteria bacterium SZAS-4]
MLNKTSFYFLLTSGGWIEVQVGDDSAQRIESGSSHAVPENGLLMRVTEYSHENRPNIWYQADVLNMDAQVDKAVARKNFEKFGLPTMVRTQCWAQADDCANEVLKKFRT